MVTNVTLSPENVRKLGLQFGLGLMQAVALVLIAGWLLAKPIDYFRATDATDESWNKRSGLRIITDKETGCQYFVGQQGGVTPRLNKECGK